MQSDFATNYQYPQVKIEPGKQHVIIEPLFEPTKLPYFVNIESLMRYKKGDNQYWSSPQVEFVFANSKFTMQQRASAPQLL